MTNVPTRITKDDMKKLKAGFIQLLMNEDLPEVRQFLKNTIKKITVTFNLKMMN